MRYINQLLCFLIALTIATVATAHGDHDSHQDMQVADTLDTLENYRTDSDDMMSSGLPSEQQFRLLKDKGVRTVIDLIPGDRSDEQALVSTLGMTYHNVPVDWQNPTINDFSAYVESIDSARSQPGIVLTHCRKNWRGAVFTYLYQVTQQDVPDETARKALVQTWQPNETWQAFINDVKAAY